MTPPDADGEFIASMEEVLDTYEEPYNPDYRVLCMDEQPAQLHKEVRRGTAAGLSGSGGDGKIGGMSNRPGHRKTGRHDHDPEHVHESRFSCYPRRPLPTNNVRRGLLAVHGRPWPAGRMRRWKRVAQRLHCRTSRQRHPRGPSRP
ncbi:MAG: hypothetical protein GYA36_20360 [Veillonellaceae bacterium]|nr:hypothetical protein [Veillonellaceae bacterium]